MQVKQFEDKYDKEFVQLMLEVDKRIDDWSKSDKLKINSWVKSLCLPTTNVSWKKNRNLYAILLLDNVLNQKLEDPFDKFCKEDLKVLSPTVVKSKLSKKFITEINFANSNDDIQTFIDDNFTKENDEQKIIDDYIKQDFVFDKKPKTKKKSIQKSAKNPDVISPVIQRETRGSNNQPTEYQTQYQNYIPSTSKGTKTGSDILLNKKYFGLKSKMKNEYGFNSRAVPDCKKLERFKLEAMIKLIKNEMEAKDQIIKEQAKDLKELKNKVRKLEKKANILFGSYTKQ